MVCGWVLGIFTVFNILVFFPFFWFGMREPHDQLHGTQCENQRVCLCPRNTDREKTRRQKLRPLHLLFPFMIRFFLIKVCAPSDCSLIQLLFLLLIEMKLLKTKLTRIVLFSFSFHLFFHLQGTSSINRNKLTYLMVVNTSHNNKSYY